MVERSVESGKWWREAAPIALNAAQLSGSINASRDDDGVRNNKGGILFTRRAEQTTACSGQTSGSATHSDVFFSISGTADHLSSGLL